MRKHYPAYVEIDHSRRRQRELGRQIGRMVRRNQGRGFVFENKRGAVRSGWFRLPVETGRAHFLHRFAAGAGSSFKLFDYIAAGGARWIAAGTCDVPFFRGRRAVYALAGALLIVWFLFRYIPPP